LAEGSAKEELSTFQKSSERGHSTLTWNNFGLLLALDCATAQLAPMHQPRDAICSGSGSGRDRQGAQQFREDVAIVLSDENPAPLWMPNNLSNAPRHRAIHMKSADSGAGQQRK
jgi:hypothetical protein